MDYTGQVFSAGIHISLYYWAVFCEANINLIVFETQSCGKYLQSPFPINFYKQ